MSYNRLSIARIEGRSRIIAAIIAGSFGLIGILLTLGIIPFNHNNDKQKYLIIELREMPGNYLYNNKSFILITHNKNELKLQTNNKGQYKLKPDLIREADENKPFKLICEGYTYIDTNIGTMTFNDETIVFKIKEKTNLPTVRKDGDERKMKNDQKMKNPLKKPAKLISIIVFVSTVKNKEIKINNKSPYSIADTILPNNTHGKLIQYMQKKDSTYILTVHKTGKTCKLELKNLQKQFKQFTPCQ